MRLLFSPSSFLRKIVEVSVCFVSLAWNATKKEITLLCALGWRNKFYSLFMLWAMC